MAGRALAKLALVALALAAGLAPARSAVTPSGEASAGIRIALPPNARVAVHPGEQQVALELPAGAEYPDDFAEASHGLLEAVARVIPEGERVRLEIDIASGRLDRVEFEPEALVLHFISRYALLDRGADAEEEYVLGPQDRLRVYVFNHADLTGIDEVSGDGTITLAHIGEVEAAGLTPGQLSARLTERLAAIIVDPRVDVEVEEYRSQWVTLMGEVRRNGRVPLRGGTQLKEVLGESEGFLETAGEEILISRVLASGETKQLKIDRKEFENGTKNPMLQHGDIIEIPRADYCYCDGEVEAPGRVRIERGITLMRALSLCGGVTDWADRTAVRLRDGKGTETIYNLKRIINGRVADPVLRGGEYVVVPRRFL